MGVDLPLDHDDRYAYAQEWWDIVGRLWTEPRPLRHRRPLLAAQGRRVDAEAVRRPPADPQRRLFDAGSRLRGAQLERRLHGRRRAGRRRRRSSRPSRRTRATTTGARSVSSRLRTASAARRRPRRRSSTAGTPRRTPTGTRSTT